MFTKLGLQNFKAWKGAHSVRLAPLTLLLGVNSAGKTSLLQPLLLLKQTAESPDRQQALNLGGQPGDLLADSLSIQRQGRSNVYEVVVTRGAQRANLVDVGFGISQVLPVITLAYFVPRGSTIILEQPEIHLHPLAQANLADLLVEVSQEQHVQFLVETHSEHLFRRLQSLIAEMTTSPAECALYFVDRSSDNAAVLKTLEMDDFGRIKNWPPKLFGDAVGETERQTRRMLQRRSRLVRVATSAAVRYWKRSLYGSRRSLGHSASKRAGASRPLRARFGRALRLGGA